MLRIMELPSSPYEKLQSTKTCEFGEKATVLNAPPPRAGKSLIHRTALFISLIIALSYPILFINRVHITCFIIHRLLWHYIRKLREAFFSVECGPRALTVLATEKLQKRTLQEKLSPFTIWRTSQDAAQILSQRQQMHLSAPALSQPGKRNRLWRPLQEGCNQDH